MKIVLVGPKTNSSNHYDGIVWNYYLPLKSLGHEVFLLNTLVGDNNTRLQTIIDEKEPDLIFTILTGEGITAEPLRTIKHCTDNTEIVTFNLFCDDSWRFEQYSSKKCHNFNFVGTTEPNCLEKYKNIGYNNVILTQWHANDDLYSIEPNKNKIIDVAHIGALYPDREKQVKYLKANDIDVQVFSGVSFDHMIDIMSQSLIVLSFSRNPNDKEGKTQMKQRPFEIAATGALALIEYHNGMENYFESNREAVYFENEASLLLKLKKLLDRPAVALNLSKRGHEKYRAKHTSRLVLESLLSRIMNGDNQ